MPVDVATPSKSVCEQSARVISGAEAMAMAFQMAGVKIAYTFPITPQSEVMDYFARQADITCVRADSEYNVLAGASGVLWAGERCAVATASQGLILMTEVMWEVAGNRLPLVMGVFNRGLKGPGWALGAQQNDSLMMRDTGWLQFYCESSQEVFDFVLMGFRIAETVSLPMMVVGDGFYLSHEREETWIPDADAAADFVGQRDASGLPLTTPPANFSGLMPPPLYHAAYRRMHRDHRRALDVLREVANDFEERFGRRYDAVDSLGCEDAEIILISAGTISGTVYDVVQRMRYGGRPVGMIKLRAFRPFPAAAIRRLVGSGKKVGVFDRNLAVGAGGIMTSEVRNALAQDHQARRPNRVYGMVTGLGGLDVTPDMIRLAVEYIATHDYPPETLFLTEDGVDAARH